jgi:two-component sensor histidine kinase
LTPDERLPEMLGNVTVLERPFHPAVLANAVRSALRARARQREVEAHLLERQRTHERQSLLIRELHHRVKNTLSTVQGLLGATARSTQSVDQFYHSFSSRIISLANTHNLLTEDYWQTASLHEILKAELTPYDNQSDRRLRIEGPTVELSADLAVPTGMAIHELTTNAAKYGALSVPQGKIEVTWDLAAADDARKLRLLWVERNGPPVEKPQRKGFGSTLLQRVLATQCNADIRFEFEPEGLRFHMDVPLLKERLVPQY